MGTPGYIYVLENPSIPNCVKIGKTINDPSNRAAQLSSATGVPLPFAVIYDAYFKDCDMAEMYVHALLEARSMRVTNNREFFSVPTGEAIAAVKQAEAKFGYQRADDSNNSDQSQFSDPLLSKLSIENSEDDSESGAEPWEEILSEAQSYDYGTDDILEDKSKAIEKYKIAAKLGSSDAYLRLSEIYASEYGDKKKGLEWLKQGADRNLQLCWVELGIVFSGKNIYFGNAVVNIENALKCFRRYLKYDDYENPASMRVLFSVLKLYLTLATSNSQYFKREEVEMFVLRLRDMIKHINDQEEVNAKLRDMRALLGKYELTKSLVDIL